MKFFFRKIVNRLIFELIFKKWIVGICKDNIKDIIRNKTFNPNIKWLSKKAFDKYYADPFHINSSDMNFNILVEEYTIENDYGRIALLTFDKDFKQVKNKILLDTQSHLSYPFVFIENNKTYIFPEAAQSGKLSCYEYDSELESIIFLQDVLYMPLLDSTILKYDSKYWIFGTLRGEDKDYNLYIFFSENLLGPYIPHLNNPVKRGLDGTRSAGHFIEVDGTFYRPTQNCKKEYGESISLNKVIKLDEVNFIEESYMRISINKKNRNNNGVHSIHTINAMDDTILVDGVHWSFSPFNQFKKNHMNSKLH